MKQTILSLLFIGFFSLSLEAQVLEQAISMRGERIGSSMCFELVEAVLIQTGQKIDTLGMVDSARPGDVFITYGFYRYSQSVSKYRLIESIGSHVAIVKKVLGNDCYLIIEQNADGKGSEVTESIINLGMHGFVNSLGYAFIRPIPGEFTAACSRLVRGIDHFSTTNDCEIAD